MPADQLDLHSSAILLDIDGTLLDIAPTPLDVHVSSDLKNTLSQLAKLTNGALAFVSGRPVAEIDHLFEPPRLASIGGHGAELRYVGSPCESRIDQLIDDDIRSLLASAIAQAEGVILEDKGYSLALHYRLAPHHVDLVRNAMNTARARRRPPLELLPGKSVIEIKSAHFTKGTGVRELMLHPQFAGRRPIFIGDDVSDESVFEVLPEFSGLGFSVGRKIDGLAGWFETPADVRK